MRLSWRERVDIRDSAVFLVLCTRHWLTDPRAQAQAQYARQAQKPFLVALFPDVRLPEDAFVGVQDLEIVRMESADPEVVGKQVLAALQRRLESEGA